MRRYGVIGGGMMGQEHIRYLAMLEGAKVAAVADPHEDMRTRAVAAAGLAAVPFDDHRAMLAAMPDLDALVVATPNHTHRAVMQDLVPTGLPILLEKPVCTTVADCHWMATASAGRRAPIWIAMEYRYMPPVARLIELVRAGEIGRLHMLSIREHRYPFLNKVGHWNRFRHLSGGTMVEKCCHFFDLMRLITGAEPVRLFATGGQAVNHLGECYADGTPDIVDHAYVLVDFAGGVRCCLELCMFAEGSYHQEHVSAVGDAGKIEALIPGPARFWPGQAPRHAEVILSPRAAKAPERLPILVNEDLLHAGDHHGSTFFQHQRFLAMLQSGGPPEVSLADGVVAVEMGLAAEHSLRTGQPVILPMAVADR